MRRLPGDQVDLGSRRASVECQVLELIGGCGGHLQAGDEGIWLWAEKGGQPINDVSMVTAFYNRMQEFVGNQLTLLTLLSQYCKILMNLIVEFRLWF